jgi:polyisoprenoid-binding protein YceI
MHRFNLLNFLALFFVISPLFSTEYQVNREVSKVSFKIEHAVVIDIEGVFKEFSGTYDFDKNNSTFGSFVGEVEAASIETGNRYRDKHLKEMLFDVENYPKLSLKLLKQDGNHFYVDLTIKDITKSVMMTISLVENGKDLFHLIGEIDRNDFNLDFSDTTKIGEMSVGDKVKIDILFGA